MYSVKEVNDNSIRAAIELGCRTMQRVFNADDSGIPFFGSSVWPDASLSFSAHHSEAHIPGRHLNALLTAQDALGIDVDEASIDAHTKAAFFSYSGPVALPLNRAELDGPLRNFLTHNIREGFHALYALVRYRQSETARQLAEASIGAILDHWDPEIGWDQRLADQHKLIVDDSTFAVGLGRALGPLVKYYRTTGYGSALQLATLLKEKALTECFPPDGSYNRQVLGNHTHSTTCLMSSLAQYADLTRDSGIMNRVRSFYDKGLWQIRDEIGWVIESSREDADPDRGEINNTGDIVETALILGKWGQDKYYQDAERILRGHFLPSQLRDVSFISEPPNPNNDDGLNDIANRHLGAFGFPAPYGHKTLDGVRVSFNMDIVGGAVASLCEAFLLVSTFGDDGHRVNMLFDHETSDIAIESPYTQSGLSIRVKRAGPLWVRMPDWVSDNVKVTGIDEQPVRTAGHLLISRPKVNIQIFIDFMLAESTVTLRHRTRSFDVRLRGDAVVAMENFGADLTFFPAI